MKRLLFRLIPLVVLIATAVFVVIRLDEHDLSNVASQPFEFTSARNHLSGTLWLPEAPVRAAVALVHGDGPQDRSSGGGYAPLIRHLLANGIAVASWDKAGIGHSRGQWLEQSMADRAAETREALDLLRRELPGVPTGALGFSQAGWVLPKLRNGDADFLVLGGPAVSWAQQGDYYLRTRLRLQGDDATQIAEALAKEAAKDAELLSPTVRYTDIAGKANKAGMSEERWGFIRRNHTSNAEHDLAGLDIPLLAIWGADDLNVDARRDAGYYRQLAHSSTGVPPQVLVLPQATHGLLQSPYFNYQLVDDWPLWAKALFLLQGRNAFAPGALDAITRFILTQAELKGPNR